MAIMWSPGFLTHKYARGTLASSAHVQLAHARSLPRYLLREWFLHTASRSASGSAGKCKWPAHVLVASAFPGRNTANTHAYTRELLRTHTSNTCLDECSHSDAHFPHSTCRCQTGPRKRYFASGVVGKTEVRHTIAPAPASAGLVHNQR